MYIVLASQLFVRGQFLNSYKLILVLISVSFSIALTADWYLHAVMVTVYDAFTTCFINLFM